MTDAVADVAGRQDAWRRPIAFRWRGRLASMRRYQAPIPVLFDRHDSHHAVILEDGTLDEHPALRLRD